MSVINDSSLSYYHFKHFSRLVKSSLDPLKLETANPDVIKSNCFFSIFDFIAYNKINLFRIIKLNENEIDQEYDKALKLLKDKKMEKFIEKFLTKFNISNPNLIKEVISDTIAFLEILSTKNEIKINDVMEKRTLHEWLIRSVNDPNTIQEVQKQLHIDAIKKQQDELINIINEIENLQKAWKKHFSDDNLLEKKLNEIRGELFG